MLSFSAFFLVPVDPDQATGVLPVSMNHNPDSMPMGSNPCYQSKTQVVQDAIVDTVLTLTDNPSYASVTPLSNS